MVENFQTQIQDFKKVAEELSPYVFKLVEATVKSSAESAAKETMYLYDKVVELIQEERN